MFKVISIPVHIICMDWVLLLFTIFALVIIQFVIRLSTLYFHNYAVVNCEDLPVPPNGMITYLSGSSGNRPVGTVATFSCNQPFSLIGETFRTCELQFDDNGRLCEWDWTGIQPGCTSKLYIDCFLRTLLSSVYFTIKSIPLIYYL